MLSKSFSKKLLLGLLLAAIIVVAIIFVPKLLKNDDVPNPPDDKPYSQSFKRAAIVTNGKECAAIGLGIFEKGGTVADAAIASLICEGVAAFQSTGVGGGFLLTIYKRDTGVVETLNAREAAPLAAHKDMFKDNPGSSTIGGLAVAVPGELRGFQELYNRYGGKVSWSELVQPTINLCRTGILITDYTANVLRTREKRIFKEPTLREIFINPKTNRTWASGEKMLRLEFASFLEVIAAEGPNALYNGSLTDGFVQDIKNFGGIITKKDLEIYTPKWEKPIVADLPSDMKMYTIGLPGSGPVLKLILNVLKKIKDKTLVNALTWHHLVEVFKHGYGVRSEFGDPAFVPGIDKMVEDVTSEKFAEYVQGQIHDNYTINDPKYYGARYQHPEDHGTAHLSFVAPNGDAIAVTSTINLVLGAFIRSPSTGIILNDEMDDFSDPHKPNEYGLDPSPANFIEPQKRPLSSMCPSIVVDKNGDVRLIVGGAGGTKITSSVALVSYRNLFLNYSIVDAIVDKRLHHQLSPMRIAMETGFPDDVVEGLLSRKHHIKIQSSGDGFAAVTAIARENGLFTPFSDIRRNGSVAGLN